MGDQVKEFFNWARQRKVLTAALVGLTLVVGILIGSVLSGRVSATKGFGFAGTAATPLTVPDPIPATTPHAKEPTGKQRPKASQPWMPEIWKR